MPLAAFELILRKSHFQGDNYEITKGECKLEVIDGVLTRVINLVGVDIFHTNKEGVLFNLRETKQVLKNGTETVREFEHSV